MSWQGVNLYAWLAGISTLGLLAGLAITLWLHSQYHLDIIARPVPPPGEGAALVSVIVPARNEQRNIQRCVQALLEQTYTSLEVIVVDDRSSDETPALLAELIARREDKPPALRVLHGAELPAGWAGKPHALAQGAAQARGDWLCFVDADTFASPQLIAAALAAAEAYQADMFSIFTSQELGSFWECAIQPLVFTALSVGFAPRRINDARRPEALANGQFILIRRSVYAALGGHQAIRQHVVEDKALAELVKRNGYRLLVGDGRLVASTRMYTSLAEIWEGWTKNIYLGMRHRLGLLLVGALLGLTGALILPAWLLGGLGLYLATGQPMTALIAGQGLALWTALIYARWQVCRTFGISPWYAFTLPLGAAVFTAMMGASAFKVLTGRGVTWKGRRYHA